MGPDQSNRAVSDVHVAPPADAGKWLRRVGAAVSFVVNELPGGLYRELMELAVPEDRKVRMSQTPWRYGRGEEVLIVLFLMMAWQWAELDVKEEDSTVEEEEDDDEERESDDEGSEDSEADGDEDGGDMDVSGSDEDDDESGDLGGFDGLYRLANADEEEDSEEEDELMVEDDAYFHGYDTDIDGDDYMGSDDELDVDSEEEDD
jgi:hypothetical protein